MLNIIYMTRRCDRQAQLNLQSILHTAVSMNVALSIGYGGDNKDYATYINNELTKINDDNKQRIRLLVEPDSSTRLRWAYEIETQWVLPVSDDDVFTNNHPETLAEASSKTNGDEISNILPAAYIINQGINYSFFRPPIISDDNKYNRLASFLTAKYTGLRYYSVIRRDVFINVFECFKNDNFWPSYCDQLVGFQSAIRGKSIYADRVSFLVYDVTNWSTLDVSIKSDSAFYRKKPSVLLHELFWIRDYRRLLEGETPPDEFLKFFTDYCSSRVRQAVSLLDRRKSLISEISAADLEVCKATLKQVETKLLDKPSWPDLRLILDFAEKGDLNVDEYVSY